MKGVETLAWLVLAFSDGSDCLLQGSFHGLPQGRTFVREDGCAVQSQQDGGYLVFWSDHRWVAIRIPSGAKSLSYRWGRAVAHVNGDSVNVQQWTVHERLLPWEHFSEMECRWCWTHSASLGAITCSVVREIICIDLTTGGE